MFEWSENTAITRRLLIWTMQLLLACCDGCGPSFGVQSSIHLHLRMRIQLTKLRWRYCLGFCKEHCVIYYSHFVLYSELKLTLPHSVLINYIIVTLYILVIPTCTCKYNLWPFFSYQLNWNSLQLGCSSLKLLSNLLLLKSIYRLQ